jgi:hypothetical protein
MDARTFYFILTLWAVMIIPVAVFLIWTSRQIKLTPEELKQMYEGTDDGRTTSSNDRQATGSK